MKNSDTKEYRSDGVRFFGRLYLDLHSLDSGLPPQTKAQIQLVKNKSSFVLMREKSDTENYEIKITQCNLFVPIAQVSAPIFNELNTVFSSKNVSLHFRKSEIRLLNIPKDKEDFYSENLFPDDIPCRLTFCFVNDDARQGDFGLNPFEFRRHWDVEDKSGFTRTSELSREDLLEREVRLLRQLIESRFSGESGNQSNPLNEDQPLKSKASGASKSKGRKPSFLKRLRSSFGEQNQTDDSASEASSIERPPPYSDDPDPPPKLKRIFIKKVELLLNGSPVDQAYFLLKLLFTIYTFAKLFFTEMMSSSFNKIYFIAQSHGDRR